MKNSKVLVIGVLSSILAVWWFALAIPDIREEMSNYLWQGGLSLMAIVVATVGLLMSRHWDGLKSGVGRAIFFISLGVLTWGLGQAGWTYYTIAQPEIEVPRAPVLDFLYFATVPLWTYGIWQLSKATGAKYGLRRIRGKVYASSVFFIISIVSYLILVEVARGGFSAYFDSSSLPAGSLPLWWIAFTDLGYAFGDALNLALALAIFGLSWDYLGGRFKRPILIILFAFGLMYIADFFFSYYDGLGEYFNGHWVDLAYLVVMSLFGIALSLMDPTKKTQTQVQQITEVSTEEVQHHAA